MKNVIFKDVDQSIIDNEFLIEQEHDGMENDASSEPMNDLDFNSPQPELNAVTALDDFDSLYGGDDANPSDGFGHPSDLIEDY